MGRECQTVRPSLQQQHWQLLDLRSLVVQSIVLRIIPGLRSRRWLVRRGFRPKIGSLRSGGGAKEIQGDHGKIREMKKRGNNVSYLKEINKRRDRESTGQKNTVFLFNECTWQKKYADELEDIWRDDSSQEIENKRLNKGNYAGRFSIGLYVKR